MDESSRQFIEFLKSLRNEKDNFNQKIQADPGRAFVYYLAPLSNIIRIFESEGILPRNMANNYDDLSDYTIQNNREKTVQLCNARFIYTRRLHDCVNFFLNPLNKTYYAFRRNALIRRNDDLNSGVVGILEIDLERLLHPENTAWFVSDGNLAVRNSKDHNYSDFSWENIYSIKSVQDYQDYSIDQARSAEFLLYIDEKGKPGCVSVEWINRLLIFQGDMSRINESIRDIRGVHIIQEDSRVFVLGDRLYNDKLFADQLSGIIDATEKTIILTRVIHRLMVIERELDFNLKKGFINPGIAINHIHGLAHVTRVMFWILMLSEILREKDYPIDDFDVTTALYAGFFHDLCRENDREEPHHGYNAAVKYTPHIKKHLRSEYVRKCIEAIAYHSIDDDPANSDLAWRLLKDADALDRGRFDKPYSNRGCIFQKLILPIFTDEPVLAQNLLYGAYYLAKVTGYINWTDNACQDLATTILSSLTRVYETLEDQDEDRIRGIRTAVKKYYLTWGDTGINSP